MRTEFIRTNAAGFNAVARTMVAERRFGTTTVYTSVMNPAEGSISKCSLADLLSSDTAKSQIEIITAENYQNAQVLLAQEYEKNNQVFLYQANGRIQGFFMVGWSVIRCDGTDLNTVFLGLSSVAAAHKGKGIGGTLYRAFVKDAQLWEIREKESLIWWFHTASLVVARVWWKIASDIAPDPSGHCSEDLLIKLRCIKAAYGLASFASEEVPYLLRGYAKARYALSEVERLSNLRANAFDDILTHLQVDEGMGDRLLFVGRLPS